MRGSYDPLRHPTRAPVLLMGSVAPRRCPASRGSGRWNSATCGRGPFVAYRYHPASRRDHSYRNEATTAQGEGFDVPVCRMTISSPRHGRAQRFYSSEERNRLITLTARPCETYSASRMVDTYWALIDGADGERSPLADSELQQ